MSSAAWVDTFSISRALTTATATAAAAATSSVTVNIRLRRFNVLLLTRVDVCSGVLRC